ncbi:FAD-dependent oxidoreductase [Ascidiimonas sp. W6]|uniref:FAD-dependent oxidoreductase n=1 Tax=Ascidiimonas meishanensis TaxID=3128903 RepID=UPI0030EF1FB1
MFDVLIIGGGAAGMQCALVLGSAAKKEFAASKAMAIVLHQKTSHLQTALFNNVLGIPIGTTGKQILEYGKQQLTDLYPEVIKIEKEKVQSISEEEAFFNVITNKSAYKSKIVVVAVGYTDLFSIKGLEEYRAPHPMAQPEKNRIWLKNENYIIKPRLYVAGTLAGGRSQFAIAAGSGAQVATDILTLWNNGKHVKIHDKI